MKCDFSKLFYNQPLVDYNHWLIIDYKVLLQNMEIGKREVIGTTQQLLRMTFLNAMCKTREMKLFGYMWMEQKGGHWQIFVSIYGRRVLFKDKNLG